MTIFLTSDMLDSIVEHGDAHHLNDQQLAEKLKMTASTLSRWLSRKTSGTTPESWHKVAEIIGVDISKFEEIELKPMAKEPKMQIALSEALRLKNEFAAAINRFRSGTSVSHGQTFKDDKKEFESQYNPTAELPEYMDRLIVMFGMNLELNNVIDKTNKAKLIPAMVREKANIDVLIMVLREAIPCSVPREWSEVEMSPDGKSTVNVTKKFVPWASKADLKVQIKELKDRKRELEGTIASTDASTMIDLSFSYDDIDELTDN